MTPQKTTVDWLRFRTQSEPRDVLESLRPMYGHFQEHIRLQHLERGILGFKQAANICIADMPIGRIDFGGESQRGWTRVDISGKGCEFVQDWDALGKVEELPQSQIRRLDIALTTWEGQIGHDDVVQAHTDGRFTTRGRPPKLQQVISSDPRQGRTCYIGEREKSDKFMRCYEKGLEMVGKLRRQVTNMPAYVTALDGHPIEGIYRCEVELKAQNTDIPWEVVERRDQYFAGAYPFCADILPNVEADILQRRPEREAQLTLEAALINCRIQYGPTLFTALAAYGGDMTAIWDKIIGNQHNQTLLEAGVLLVDHN